MSKIVESQKLSKFSKLLKSMIGEVNVSSCTKAVMRYKVKREEGLGLALVTANR